MFKPTVKKVDFDEGAHRCIISKSLKLSKLEYKLFHYNVSSFILQCIAKYKKQPLKRVLFYLGGKRITQLGTALP